MRPTGRGKLVWKLGDLLETRTREFAELEALDKGKAPKRAGEHHHRRRHGRSGNRGAFGRR
jgi:acyl-CoA reductase-like NAD-dependent aldehyde dehydrogenase